MSEINQSSNKQSRTFIFILCFFLFAGNAPQAQASKNKTTSLHGKIYRSDTNQILPGVKISLSSYQGKSLETKTDEQGNYSLEQVKAGKYRVSISVRYKNISDVPCNIGTGSTNDKNSYVNMKDEGLGYVDVWVSIDPFVIQSGKVLTKDFDVKCKGFSKNRSRR